MTREERDKAIRILQWLHNNNFLFKSTEEDVKYATKLSMQVLEQESIAQERYEDLCEYFGNMKDILNSREDFKAWLGRIKWHICKAEEMYEKYEQEPCDDTISRKAAINAMIKLEQDDIDRYGCMIPEGFDSSPAIEALDGLPPVNPQPCTDAISRQGLLNNFEKPMNWTDSEAEVQEQRDYESFVSLVESVPSVTPRVKTGHWKAKSFHELFCDNCGFDFDIMRNDFIDKMNYCPNCGAKMQEVEG